MFKRSIINPSAFVTELHNTHLWQLLKPDIASGEVFPAVRNDYVCFYHKGSCLFTFDLSKKFRTHIKYAAVIDLPTNYITEKELSGARGAYSFSNPTIYKRIKENAARYAGQEASGVADLCRNSSIAKELLSSTQKDAQYVVLDIEIAFGNHGGSKTAVNTIDQQIAQEIKDASVTPKKGKPKRLDILLLDTVNGNLRFVEAKHFSNSEIWAQKGNKPKVVRQIKNYEQMLGDLTLAKQIVSSYQESLNLLGKILGVTYQGPDLRLDPQIPLSLWIFGFDQNQRDGRLTDLLINDHSLDGIYFRNKGSTKIDAKSLWNQTQLGK